MPSRRLVGASALLLASLALTACDAGSALSDSSDGPSGPARSGAAGTDSQEPAGRLVANVKRGATVPVDKIVSVRATDARLTEVTLSSSSGSVSGALADDGRTWTASDRLEPGESYTVKALAQGADGAPVRRTTSFATQALTLDDQTYPSVAPLAGETVGVGMPVIVSFDVPVTDRAEFERHMKVTSEPAQRGSWHWLSANEAHWRPAKYWQAGTKVSVDVDVNGVAAGNGVYGQEDREVDFEVGDAHVYKVDAAAHHMSVFSNGKLLRTLPITTGKPGFTTRSGTKVIMEKYDRKRMNSETVGIAAGSADAYDIDNVQWAMRVTASGEFIHAAPWSTGSQGHANVSHGCTGMSTADAGWLYEMSRRGDVVEYTGTDRPMTLDNGYGDWNASFADYAKGSALR
ncbi:Ig-like domain-containing protein [Nocardioides sp. cx-169]|uniref:L,D-transpeptidase n=1 Tax=Nocardioides sp. cx-169 TaxID=2899080 RepID=UPI001E5A223E|nr:Ig-like domain-containing protein [Nocardioides sp. cx-169]MCD4534668.1 Ig-like domain-containing protein [Nocardioides sp. cx-169]